MKKSVQNKSILQMIKRDHQLLRESLAALTQEDVAPSEKKKQLERFIFNLKVHSKAEEQSLYNSLVELQEIRPQILEGFEEHQMADQLIKELESTNFQTEWTDEAGAKAKVLAELVAHHLKEEEEELFPKIKTYLTKTELENLGVIYLQIRKDLRRKLESRFTLPSFKMVSSFVSSKFSVHR